MSATDALLGLYIKSAGREQPNIHWLDHAAYRGLCAIDTLFASWPPSTIAALVKWQRQYAMQRVQLPDGSTQDGVLLWAGARQFTLTAPFSTPLSPDIGEAVAEPEGLLTTPESLIAYLRDYYALVATSAPSRIALMIWGHGDGPGGVLLRNNRLLAAGMTALDSTASQDASAMADANAVPIWLRLQDLERAFETTKDATGLSRPIDFLCFNACQDATVELAATVVGHARYLLASQSSTPIINGWPFDQWPKALDRRAFADDREAVQWIVTAYDGIGRDFGVLSAIDLTRIPALLTPLRAFSDALLANPDRLLPLMHRGASQCTTVAMSSNDKRDTASLFALIGDAIEGASPDVDRAAVAACRDICQAVADATVARSPDRGQSGLQGLSIYLPDGTLPMSNYALSAYGAEAGDFGGFKQATRWHEVVASYLAFINRTHNPPARRGS